MQQAIYEGIERRLCVALAHQLLYELDGVFDDDATDEEHSCCSHDVDAESDGNLSEVVESKVLETELRDVADYLLSIHDAVGRYFVHNVVVLKTCLFIKCTNLFLLNIT